ncbi:ATP-dependent helicase [Chromobacterium violaceum]|uniref:ATP-dependent helicase n=1 Tax=Chromobacterium violaceum TaxID=536 RepID=UPI0015FCE68C|nr:ATP-dependent helicase [Chromobacterium violaceum]MBA8735811.1 ATP-dependent helicase [Chromobacterium violaceum]
MSWRSSSSRYLEQAEELRDNQGQWEAYESTGHCVVLAGPGSGKTKTLTMKLARLLAEDVRAPRGVACITYSQECSRELVRRLGTLGIEESTRLFIGTVHGFCLRHLLTPYARLANLGLPHPLKVATTEQSRAIFQTVSSRLFGAQHSYRHDFMDKHRRAHVNRASSAWQSEPALAQIAELYEAELRRQGLVDFDDLVIYGQRLVLEHDWVLPLIKARFPVIAVDEYQDLGTGLHEIVQRLAFSGGVRLFAVGDADQSVYGFNGADSRLLLNLAARPDVQCVRLSLNYRCADGIIQAAERALGEVRGYRPINARAARVEQVFRPHGLADQARYAVQHIIPQALATKPGRQVGDVAILYRTAEIGDLAAEAAQAAGFDFVRIDNAAPYRKCAVTSWIEDCAAWCSGGWKAAQPKLRSLVDRWCGFQQLQLSDAARRHESGKLTSLLWGHRRNGDARTFLTALRDELLDDVLNSASTLSDQKVQVEAMHRALHPGGVLAGLDLARLGGRDGAPNQLNLLTFHSAKGCEYDVVIMLGLDEGVFPWSNEAGVALQESRRLFYVALTRARDEVYLLYSGWSENKYGRRFNNGKSRFIRALD